MQHVADDKARSPRKKRRRASEPAVSRFTIDGVMAALLVAVGFMAALAFGSVEPQLVTLWVAIMAPLAVVSALRAKPEALPLIATASALALLYAALAVIQLQSPPWFGAPDPIWAETKSLLGDAVADARLATAGGLPYEALGRVFLFTATLVTAIGLASRGMGDTLLLWFARLGAAYAALAICLFIYDPTHIFWLPKPGYRADLTGTFLGRNVAASFIGMFLTANAALAAAAYGRLVAERGSARGSRALSQLIFDVPGARWSMVGVVICALALLLTGSRAGILLALAAAALASLLVLRRYMRLSAKRLAAPLLAVFAAVLILLSLASVGDRIGGQGLEDVGRMETYKAVVKMISERPISGFGLGTFEMAFPKYRSDASIFGIWSRAHSTPLELMVEAGIPLAFLTFAIWCIGLYTLTKSALAKRAPREVVPLCATVALTLHSCIDFPLQIPACAVVFAAIFGIGLGSAVNRV